MTLASLARICPLCQRIIAADLVVFLAPMVLLMTMSRLAEAEEPVSFADLKFQVAVEKALGISDPNQTEMLELEKLAACCQNIDDITGIKYATNLTFLSLSQNDLRDITELNNLKNLESLWLGGNRIEDISAIAGMTNLEILHINSNNISDISPLANLFNLSVLRLYTNQIRDIGPVSRLTNLLEFSASRNQINDMSALDGLTNLRILKLSDNSIRDISVVSGFSNLTQLVLEENPIGDLSPVSGLENLTSLFLDHTQTNDLSSISELRNLKTLNLSNNSISDLSPLERLTDLTTLRLFNNQINDISVLAELTNLSVLSLGSNEVSDLSPIAGLTMLTSLALTNNRINDLSPLAGLVNLTNLTLSENRISDLSAIASSINLTSLFLDGNQIRSISALAGLTQLKSLGLKGNQIRDISALLVMTHLGLLDLQDNPLNLEACDLHIPAIEANNPLVVANGSRRRLGLFHDECIPAQMIFYVDDDAPRDPAPFDSAKSDPMEDGSPDHPFDTIQEGIDVAWDGATVMVHEGIYRETIELVGRDITVTGLAPDAPGGPSTYPVIDAHYAGTAVTFLANADPNCVLEGFVITRGQSDLAGGILADGASPTISNCLIVGNRLADPNASGGGAAYLVDSNAVFVNCTLSGNYGGANGAGLYLGDSNTVLQNCLLWDNLPFEIGTDGRSVATITFSNIVGGWLDSNNIDVDPLFAGPGYWADAHDPSISREPSYPDAIWRGGDYHLKSQAGRWDPNSQSWVQDHVTSPGIDAGDPNTLVGEETEPNGDRINIGAYGGTAKASRSW